MVKKGFLLLELLIGLCIFNIFISLIVNYIVEVKNTQFEALNRIEALSIARSVIEEMSAGKNNVEKSKEKKFTISITENIHHGVENIPFKQVEVKVSWTNSGKQNRSVTLNSLQVITETIKNET